MTFISEPGLDKRKYAEEILGGTPSIEDVVQKVAELEYLEEIEAYKIQRAAEYPSYSDYLDGVVKGNQDQIDAYIAACQAVKDKYPKAVIDNDTLNSRKSQALFDHQLQEYTKAIARLAQYVVADGREEVVESRATGERILNEETGEIDDVMADVVIFTSIEPVDATITRTVHSDDLNEETIENPLITKDSAERAVAQAVVDATPQPVIDEYNS